VEERVKALLVAIEETEVHLRGLGFEPARLIGAKGFGRIQAIADALDAVYTSDESKRRFEILARQVFIRFKALLMEPSALAFPERHDNLEAIYKKLTERRDTADVTELLRELHRIVNEAIRAQTSDKIREEEPQIYDLSQIDLERLRDEFAKRVKRKATTLQDIRAIVEQKLGEMLKRNPQRMDYYKKYQAIIADYNREKDRLTLEETFMRLVDLAQSLDAEQRRAVEEGLSEDELALFDLLKKDNLSKADRERLKEASRGLLEALRRLVAPLDQWTQKEQTQAEVKVFILDHLFQMLPTPPFTPQDKEEAANRIYGYVWQQSTSGLR
jgi:type I restriction enzyme, R subunit